MEEEKKVLGAGTSATPTLCGLLQPPSIIIFPHFSSTRQANREHCGFTPTGQNVQAFSADDGAIALDNEAGQRRLLQGNAEWLDGIFRKERFLRD